MLFLNKKIIFCLIFIFNHVYCQNLYPCRRVVVFSIDMSSLIGNANDQSLFNQQKNAIWKAFHQWTLSIDAIRVMITKPNGSYMRDYSALEDDVINLDDTLDKIANNEDEAYKDSNLKDQMIQVGMDIDFDRDQSVRYSVVIFTGSANVDEINNAAFQANDSLTGDLERFVVVVGDPTSDLSIYNNLGNNGVLQLSDVDLYEKLTKNICDGVVNEDPNPVPTDPSEPPYPGNVDIFVQLSNTPCPKSVNLEQQKNIIKHLIDAFTFGEQGVRMAALTPIGMTGCGSSTLYYSSTNVNIEFDSILTASLENSGIFCEPGTILDSFTEINNKMKIKYNSSAVIILFTDSNTSSDIQWSTGYRKCNFDSRGVKTITVALPGSASLKNLASPSSSFSISDYDIVYEITEAIKSTGKFNDIAVDC